MICSRCAHWNNEDDHRCTKCAARLSDLQVDSAFYTQGALALQPRVQESAVAVLDAPADPEPSPSRVPRYVTSLQQSLFSLREPGKVVSIDGLEADRRPVKRPAAPRRRHITASYLPQQGVLEFVPMAAPQTRKLATSVDAKVFCDHQVASVPHRLFAAMYDFGLFAMLALTFFGVIAWGCEDLLSAFADPFSASVLAAGCLIIYLAYHTLFLALRGETPGLRIAKLRLVDFDGRTASEKQMHRRILGAFIAVLPAGLGLIWALVDEESLTWQDHVSRTFPTPISAD